MFKPFVSASEKCYNSLAVGFAQEFLDLAEKYNSTKGCYFGWQGTFQSIVSDGEPEDGTDVGMRGEIALHKIVDELRDLVAHAGFSVSPRDHYLWFDLVVRVNVFDLLQVCYSKPPHLRWALSVDIHVTEEWKSTTMREPLEMAMGIREPSMARPSRIIIGLRLQHTPHRRSSLQYTLRGR